jgi:uncharacterized membrane protein
MGADGPSDRSLVLLLPKPVRTLPADLAVVVVLVFLACLFVVVPGLNDTPLRVVFGLPLVVFLPGYTLIAVLFPEAGSSMTADDDVPADAVGSETDSQSEDEEKIIEQSVPTLGTGRNRGIDGIERVALSFGLSIAIVPLLGLILNFTPWGIRLAPILVAVSGSTLVLTVIAAIRRWSLPEDERFRIPYQEWIDAGRAELLESDSRMDGIINILLVCSILLAVGAVAYAVAVPPQGETFTEFYLLHESGDEDDELVAANYPSEFVVGESKPVVVGIRNHEGGSVEYTVVVQLQEVRIEGNETVVLERQELDQFTSPEIGDNETWQRTYEIRPTMTGEQLWVQYLLYRGEPPASPTRENAYRDLHLEINVTED